MEENNHPTKEKILKLLEEVQDPEIQESIIDIGLIYEVEVDNEKKEIIIDMTLTSPACPLGGLIIGSVHEKMLENFKEYKTEVNLTFDPMWTPDRMKPNIRERFGFSTE